MALILDKSCEKKSRLWKLFREPGKVRAGTAEKAEHGLGADGAIGSPIRVSPVTAITRHTAKSACHSERVAERSESCNIMLAGGKHTAIHIEDAESKNPCLQGTGPSAALRATEMT